MSHCKQGLGDTGKEKPLFNRKKHLAEPDSGRGSLMRLWGKCHGDEGKEKRGKQDKRHTCDREPVFTIHF